LSKTYETLVEDIYHVLKTGEGYTKEIADWVGEQTSKSLLRQMTPRTQTNSNLRMSNLGKPDRQLWYETRTTRQLEKVYGKVFKTEPMLPSTLNKFIFGDLTEAHIVGLVMASGHKVEGYQQGCEINGIKGSLDLIIDGMLFDIKSASTRAFEKFKNNGLIDNDPFSYLSQLSSYLYSVKDDPVVKHKDKAAFLAFDKQFGHIAVDVYDFSEWLQNKETEVEYKKSVVNSDTVPERCYTDVPHNKSGNMRLDTQCSYCQFKKLCWPDLRSFAYSNGPVFMTRVVKEPTGNVMEIT
jgi:hypothetical protein